MDGWMQMFHPCPYFDIRHLSNKPLFPQNQNVKPVQRVYNLRQFFDNLQIFFIFYVI